MLTTIILLMLIAVAVICRLQQNDIFALRKKLDRFRNSLFQLSNGEVVRIGAITCINKRSVGSDTFVSFWQGNSCTMVGYKTLIEADMEIDRVLSAVVNYGKFE